jgi:hypothetical protein
MNKAEENLRDIQFIHATIVSYLGKTPKDFLEDDSIDKNEIRCTISDESGRIYICGYEVLTRFRFLASRYLGSHPDKKQKIDINGLIRNFYGEFLKRFIKGNQEITIRNIDKMISVAYKATERKFESLIHYIPCNIFHSSNIQEFQIGTIRFLHEVKFNELYGSKIENLRTDIAEEHQASAKKVAEERNNISDAILPEQSRQLADRLVDDFISSWKYYEWVAIVEIDQCTPKASYERAILSSKVALNILKLLLGGEYTDRIRLGNDEMRPLGSAQLIRGENGKLNISTSSISRGKPIGDEWLEILESDYGDYLMALSQAIELLTFFKTLPPLWERFLDALTWYGDAG